MYIISDDVFVWKLLFFFSDLAMAFQNAQNERDASAVASLFALNGVFVVPFGTGHSVVGRTAIEQSFDTYFSSLSFLNETVLSELIVSGNTVAFSKRIDTVAVNGQSASRFVINWFELECHSLTNLLEIKRFSAVFNTN